MAEYIEDLEVHAVGNRVTVSSGGPLSSRRMAVSARVVVETGVVSFYVHPKLIRGLRQD
jgi:hypothetical protein